MTQNNQDAQLQNLYETLDALHTAASEGRLDTITALGNRELLAWLHDLIYTAEETVAEIEQHSTREPILRLVPRPPQQQDKLPGQVG